VDGNSEAFIYNLRFSGQYFDAETELVHNARRDYDATIGRYVQSDPLGPAGGPHSYAYTGNHPLRYVDPFGLCRIDVRFSRLGPGWYHAYIVTSDTDGTQNYYRGGPSGLGPSGGSSGATSAGTGGSSSQSSDSSRSGPSNSGNSSSPGSGPGGAGRNNGPWGPIATEYGRYVPGTIDWDPNDPPTMNVLDNNEPCTCNDALAQAMQDIEYAYLPYNPFSTNSNAVVREALERTGYAPGTPPVWAPGWNTQLP
jgi:RHS repeat-associated protein